MTSWSLSISDQIHPPNTYTHKPPWFLSHTSKKNKNLLSKVQQVSSLLSKIKQADMHSHKSRSKTLPRHPVIPQCGSPTYCTGRLTDVFLLLIFTHTYTQTVLSLPWNTAQDNPDPTHISQCFMRIVHDLLESSLSPQINKTAQWVLTQRTENNCGRCTKSL